MWPWILWGCVAGVDTASERLEVCSRPCLDSPYHLCGSHLETSAAVSCVELAEGIEIGEWAAYRLQVGGEEIHGLRVGGILSAVCSGEAVLDTWTISTDVPGCGLVERIPVSCDALQGGFRTDPDVEWYTVEAKGVDGLQGIHSASQGGALYAECPEGVERAVITSTLSSLDLVGATP